MGMVKPYKAGAPKQKMWQAMRIMRCFTPSDIAQTSEVTLNYAKVFINALCRAGYIKRQQGETGAFARHQLLKNTGPHAPRHWTLERKVFDVNRGDIYDLA